MTKEKTPEGKTKIAVIENEDGTQDMELEKPDGSKTILKNVALTNVGVLEPELPPELVKFKEGLESQTFESLLRRWRFEEPGNPDFQDQRGDIFKEVMFRKRDELTSYECGRASSNVGWGRF